MKRDFQHGRPLINMASPMPECETIANQDVARRSGSARQRRLPKYRQIRQGTDKTAMDFRRSFAGNSRAVLSVPGFPRSSPAYRSAALPPI
jgi:hypothetical protein